MSRMISALEPDADGVSFSLAAVTASAAKTVPGGRFTITSSLPVTITWGRGGAAAATPSATVGFLLPANALVEFDAGTGANAITSFKAFNVDAATAAVISFTVWKT